MSAKQFLLSRLVCSLLPKRSRAKLALIIYICVPHPHCGSADSSALAIAERYLSSVEEAAHP